VRDALEMRRGIREEQYNNRYANVKPLVPRYLRAGIKGRLDRAGREVAPLDLDQVREAIALFKQENVSAVSVCFMNSFANPAHEQAAAEIVKKEMPGAYLSVSTDLLPSIRFYERISTTALNSYVGPKLNHYLDQLVGRLKGIGFKGLLLIMQSQRRRHLAAAGAREGRADPALRPRRRSRRRPLLRPPARPGQVHHHGHGRHQLRGLGGRRQPDDQERRRDRPPQDRPADARHPHHRRGRRLDRLARRGGPAAHGPAERRRRPRPGLLRQGRHPARHHRRQRRARLSRPRTTSPAGK
jgi:hypothetical protein